MNGRDGDLVNPNSHVVDVTIRDETGSVISVTSANTPIIVEIASDASYDDTPEMTTINLPTAEYSKFEITKPWTAFHVDIYPDTLTHQYLVLIGYDTFPTLRQPVYFEHYQVIPKQLCEYWKT